MHGSVTRSIRILVALLLLASQGWASPPTGSVAPIEHGEPTFSPGRFDARGGYHRPKEVQQFLDLHGIRDIPRHPILLLHGLFGFRKLQLGPFYFRYFVGVQEYLRRQGVECLFPITSPFASWEHRAEQIRAQIDAAGWDRFHIIAHSAGGVDARHLITHTKGMRDRVISLTTVGTPHRGVWYADFALKWVFDKQGVWKLWDWLGLRREGVENMSVRAMDRFNRETPDVPGVRYYSFGGSQPFYLTPPVLSTGTIINSIGEKAALGRSPGIKERVLTAAVLPSPIRRRIDSEPRALIQEMLGEAGQDLGWIIPELAGKNDGLVSLSSARWGTYLGDLNADHLDQMGWFSSFPARHFYRNICRFLFDHGL